MDLGVRISISENTDFDRAFAEAREAGFSHGQVNSRIHGITPEEVRLIAVAAHQAEFHVDAVGCYMNPLRPDEPTPQGADLTDWRTLAANMVMMNGVERIVCWSGTLSKSFGMPNLLNQEEDTFNRLFITLHGMFEQVRGLPIEIILEPYTAHVLHDARSCVRMAQQFPGGEVKVVLDAPNLIPSLDFAGRDARVQELVTEIAPAVGLIHLQDVALNEARHREFLPAGRGSLAYGPYLRAITQYLPEVPIILDAVENGAEMRAARDFVEGVVREYRL